MSELYIGLMSGTSIDAVDAALVELGGNRPQLIASHSETVSPQLKQRIAQLCTPGNNEIEKMGTLDIEIGALFAHAANTLLDNNALSSRDIIAIGSHGQTIRHRPPQAPNTLGFSLQIGDPNTIAARTNITTVADFRRRDMTGGGQGAPLAPVFHQAIAPEGQRCCAFLNLGGIANLTLISGQQLQSGFDCGPANTLMDAWTYEQRQQHYDANGKWARSGQVSPALLKRLLAHPYFARTPPKSTGRETFNLEWLQQQLQALPPIAAADVQATLLQLSCTSIADALRALPEQPEVIYCCGGGSANSYFMQQLAQACAPCGIDTTAALGIDPNWIEACAFAWLAQQTLHRKAVPLQAITGTSNDSALGGVYFA
ncbi:MAG: anhydro-N-acetylmuramic acid kinase [Gammaproteobacteria bacterium]|nr:anhydro-N-acetylmuramic acid kinase [Gammaproteobacteria bacterium]